MIARKFWTGGAGWVGGGGGGDGGFGGFLDAEGDVLVMGADATLSAGWKEGEDGWCMCFVLLFVFIR